jgi:hypothetical protein
MRSTRIPEWPEVGDDTSLFRPRPPLRKMRVMVDVDSLVDDGTDAWSAERMLSGIVRQRPNLLISRYSDVGPPPDAEIHEVGYGPDVAKGWITPEPDEPGGFWLSDGDSLIYTGYELSNVESYHAGTQPRSADEESFHRDAVALAVAAVVEPDLFITNRDRLLHKTIGVNGVTVCNVRQALALLGLYLRSQDDYRIWFDPSGEFNFRLGKRLYYLIAARDLLPAGWRWQAGLAQHARNTGDDELPYLAASLFDRTIQALKSRDAVHRALNQPQHDVRGDDAIEAFEVALMMLMAAVDISAVVAHKVVGLSGPTRYAGWQSPRWLPRLQQVRPALAALVLKTPHSEALTILRHLRNTVHDVAMHGTGVQESFGGRRVLMGLPKAKQQELVNAISAIGGSSAWGIEVVRSGEFHADPGLLLERLLPLITNLLNALMEETVDAIPGVTLSGAHSGPPQNGSGLVTDRFSGPQRACLRLLLGL